MIIAPTTSAPARTGFRSFGLTLVLGWFLLAIAAAGLARVRQIEPATAVPIALAFLTEFSFYLLVGWASVREWLVQRLPKAKIAWALAGIAMLPYLISTVPTGAFAWPQALVLAAIMIAVVLPWRVDRSSSLADATWKLLFLTLVGVVILSGILRWIYPALVPRLPLEVLGHVTLIRTAILTVLLLAEGTNVAIGFVPTARELGIGVGWFIPCAILVYPLGQLLGQFRTGPHSEALWQSIGLLLSILWVLALSEEFFFRALLQRWITEWTRSAIIGLITASLLFGACHLGFRHAFPNWRFATLASAAGLFYGAAFLHAKSIRASMVTHALVVSAWRLFLA